MCRLYSYLLNDNRERIFSSFDLFITKNTEFKLKQYFKKKTNFLNIICLADVD